MLSAFLKGVMAEVQGNRLHSVSMPCSGSTVLRYVRVVGKQSEVSLNILAEVDSKARCTRSVGQTATGDPYRQRKRCPLLISHLGQVFFLLSLALAKASGSKSLRKISKLNSVISNNTDHFFLFK